MNFFQKQDQKILFWKFCKIPCQSVVLQSDDPAVGAAKACRSRCDANRTAAGLEMELDLQWRMAHSPKEVRGDPGIGARIYRPSAMIMSKVT